jgi:MFS family permease
MTTTTNDAVGGGPAAKPLYSEKYTSLVLFLLALAYAINFVDRSIVTILGQAIKVDLKITDTQLGLLGGLYFALLYTVLGIPIARLAERYSRVNIIAISMIVWSGFTVACGTAANYLMLSIYRFGVGVGEAGLAPPAHSLISDYFPRHRRAQALAAFSVGVPVGTMTGAIVGGWLTTHFSWRFAFVMVGLPGILVAIIIKLLMKEPPRGHIDAEAAAQAAGDLAGVPATSKPEKAAFSIGSEFKEIGRVIRLLFGQWPVANILIGLSLVTCAGFGAGQFSAPYYVRAFGLTFAQVGMIVGVIGGISAIIGTFVSGWVIDRTAKIHASGYALAPAVALTLTVPLHIAVYNAPTWQMAALLLALPGLLTGYQLAASFAVVQNVAPVRQRATATAVLMFVMNLVGMGLGPPLAGVVIDHYAAFHLAYPDASSFWSAVRHLFDALPAFKTACPGGQAPVGAGAEAKAACHAALVLGTRHGIMTMFGFTLWGATHYALAAIGMKAAMDRAKALQAAT